MNLYDIDAELAALRAEVSRLKAEKQSLLDAALTHLEVCADIQQDRGSQSKLQLRYEQSLLALFEAVGKEMEK